jgi:parallel beta-helix repeat protein
MKIKISSISVVLVLVISMMVGVDLGFEVVPRASGTTIYVDDDGGADYTSIQDALDHANDGDTIYVYSGTYYENLRVEKRVTLIGQGRTSTTIEGESNTYVIFVLIDNVQISGFKIMGNDGYGYAGVKSSKDHITVTNCEFTNNGRGIHLWVSSFHTVKDNICRNNLRDGIYIHGCDNVTIEDNQCSQNGENGILVHGYSDHIIKNNICNENDRDGIMFHGILNSVVENNQCNNNVEAGIHGLGRNNITVIDNICNNNDDYGIFLHGAFNTTIKNNQCNHNDYRGIRLFGGEFALVTSNICNYNYMGITISGVKYCTITQNTCNFNREGVEVHWDDNYTIVNNNLNSNYWGINIYFMSNGVIENNMINHNSGVGIRMWVCSDVRIRNNSCDNNNYGLSIYNYADWNVVTNNSFNSNQLGLYMYRSSNNTFLKNDISNNDHGINMWYFSKNNIFSNNTISYNQLIGIAIDHWWRPDSINSSKHNLFYHNNIINNAEQTNSSNPSGNHWHHPILLEGNYWSDYTGLDDGSGMGKHAIAGDGIGDTEIAHPGLGFDFYPFIYSNGWDDSQNFPPTADAGADQTVHIWEPVYFDGSNSYDPNGDNLTYEWDFGDGSPHGFGINVTHVYNTTGVYNVTLKVTDEGGLSDTDFCIITVLYPPSVPPALYSIELCEGWNLISFPTIQSTSDIPILFDSISGDYGAVQWYDAGDPADPWKHHVIGKEFGNDLQDVHDTMGMWVHVTKPGGTLLLFNGFQPASTPMIPLIKGWNLVGYPFMENHTRALGLNNLQFGSDVDAIQWFDSSTKIWHFLEEGENFVIGRGYWMHATTDCVWEVPS